MDADMMDQLIEKLITSYGPIGFGLVAVLLMWHTIIKPELKQLREANQSERTRLRSAEDRLREIGDQTQRIAELNNETAKTTNSTAQVLRVAIQEVMQIRRDKDHNHKGTRP